MVEPQEPPTVPKPHISDIGQAQQVFLLVQFHKIYMFALLSQTFSTPSPSSCPAESNYASPQLRLRGFNPYCQDWVGGGGRGGVAHQLPSYVDV